MVIDLTGYFGSWPYWKTPIQESDELLELMDEHGIDRLALCSTRGIFDDWRAGNEEILELASAQPRRFIPFVTFGSTSGDRFWEPLASQGMIDLLQQYQEKGVRGWRLFPQHQGFELNEDYYMEPVLAEAARLGMVLMAHVRTIQNWGMPTYPVAEICRLAERYPQTKVVICGVNYEWREVMSGMKKHPNLMLETSGLQLMGQVAFLTETVGAERLFFGSGMALQYPQCGLVKVTRAKISETERGAILSGNTQKLLAL